MLDFDTQAIHLGLERVQKALCKLGDPHKKFPSIHVAGTNGKGSVCAMLDSILRQAGYKAGLFTSPHLFKWNERIKVNGLEIDDKSLQDRISKMSNIELTPFEKITCIAFQYFAEQGIDIAVVEVGMGGRLDATNVISPVLSIITNVELDHTEYLGDTIEKITQEKKGIIKPGIPVIFGGNQKANYKEENKATALCAIEVLRKKGFKISDEAVSAGIKKAIWPGRFQTINRDPIVIVDGAHNPAGARALRVMMEEMKANLPISLIIGTQSYKNAADILKELRPLASDLILTRSTHPQAADPNCLAEGAGQCKITNSVGQAIELALGLEKEQIILITGSIFVVADALKYFGKPIDAEASLM